MQEEGAQREGGQGEGRKARDIPSEPEEDDSDGVVTGRPIPSPLFLITSPEYSLLYGRVEGKGLAACCLYLSLSLPDTSSEPEEDDSDGVVTGALGYRV